MANVSGGALADHVGNDAVSSDTGKNHRECREYGEKNHGKPARGGDRVHLVALRNIRIA